MGRASYTSMLTGDRRLEFVQMQTLGGAAVNLDSSHLAAGCRKDQPLVVGRHQL